MIANFAGNGSENIPSTIWFESNAYGIESGLTNKLYKNATYGRGLLRLRWEALAVAAEHTKQELQ